MACLQVSGEADLSLPALPSPHECRVERLRVFIVKKDVCISVKEQIPFLPGAVSQTTTAIGPDYRSLKPTNTNQTCNIKEMDEPHNYKDIRSADFQPLQLSEPVQPFDMDEIFSIMCRADDDEPITITAPEQVSPSLLETQPVYVPGPFLELPVEIRLRIYEFALWDPPSMPPPITQVCRCVREESLEYWYATARWPINFCMKWSGKVWEPPSESMVCRVPDFANPVLRKMSLVPRNSHGDRFLLDLDQKTNSYSIRFASRDVHGNQVSIATESTYRLLQQLDTTMARIMIESGGVGNITFDYYERLIFGLD